MLPMTTFRIKKWRRISKLVFTGELYRNDVYDCDVTLATVAITEFHDRIILEDLHHKYTLMRIDQR